jgi:hypothetical protein
MVPITRNQMISSEIMMKPKAWRYQQCSPADKEVQHCGEIDRDFVADCANDEATPRERANRGAEGVDGVKPADPRGGGLDTLDHWFGKQRERKAHGRQQREKDHQKNERAASRNRLQVVEDEIVEQKFARGRERANARLAERERTHRATIRQPIGKAAGQQAPEAETKEKGANNDSRGNGIRPAEEPQYSLPCRLID